MAELRQSFSFPLCIATLSDVGRVRTNNEDAFAHAWLEDGSLFVIVCDGMGGHEAGEVASGLAVRVVEDAVSRDCDIDPRQRLFDGLLEANAVILDEGRRSGTKGMGTTAITAVMQGPQIYIGLIGDSRLFHIRKGQMVWRTLDHTRVQMLVDNGEISDEEARDHPEAGMLTRALGHSRMADGRELVPDILADPIVIEAFDMLILSSDGLHDLLEDWEIAQAVAGKSPDEAVRLLVDMACERGGHDNVTVAAVCAGERTLPYDPHFQPIRQDHSVNYEDEHEDSHTYNMSGDGGGYDMSDVAAAPPANNKMMMVGVAAVIVFALGVIALLLIALILVVAIR